LELIGIFLNKQVILRASSTRILLDLILLVHSLLLPKRILLEGERVFFKCLNARGNFPWWIARSSHEVVKLVCLVSEQLILDATEEFKLPLAGWPVGLSVRLSSFAGVSVT